MPTTVTASNGDVYHLLQLSTANSVKQFEESIGFSRLRNKLSDGYRSQVLYGSNTGNRGWRLTFPTLAHSTLSLPTVTDINGATVSREEYLWSLFCETQISGEPFVIQSERNGQYYLCEFVDEKLTYSGMKVKLYSTGVELEQVRIEGVTIFDMDNTFNTGYTNWWYDETGHASPNWDAVDKPTSGEYGLDMAGTGDVIYAGNPQNGHNTVRFNSVGTTGKLTVDLGGGFWREMFIVMKVRETTFGQTSAVVVDGLVGTSGTTKFANLVGFGDYEYRLNGLLYESGDHQAPMNEWGVVHLRVPGGFGVSFIGNDSAPGSQAEIDVGEIIATAGLFAAGTEREITEHLALKWALT